MRVGVALLFQNYADMDRYEAMERGEEVGAMVTPDRQIMSEQFALADLVEPLGFDTLWTFEHRTTPYIMLPNPQQFISYFAGRTKRIDFGTMVTVMPWHDPVRLAESLALLTHLLGPTRRCLLGLGRGVSRREFAALGIDMNESRQRFAEGLEIVRRAFHEERFSYSGKVFNYENVSVRPRPLTTEIVDEAYAVWTSDASLEVAAELGLNALTIPSKDLEAFKEDLDSFDDIRAHHGYGPGKPPILQLFMHCRESSQEARETAEQYFGEYADISARHYEFGGSHFDDLPSYASYRQDGKAFVGGGAKSMSEAALASKERILREGLVGTPDECIQRVETINAMLGPSEIVLVSTPGSIPSELAEKSLRMFSEKALPAIHAIGSAPNH